MSHVHIVEALLYEVGLQDVQRESTGLKNTERLEFLWSLLGALKAFLHIRFKKSMTGWPRFACVSSVDFMYAFITSLKLTTLQAPGWDLAVVRQDLALHDLVERQIRDMDALVRRRKMSRSGNSLQHRQLEQDPYERLTTMLRGVSTILKTMSEPLALTPPVTETVPPLVEDLTPDLDMLSTLSPDAWQDIWVGDGYDYGGDWI
jgi:hypothetical protein